MFQIHRMCFRNRLTVYKLIINVWHQELVKQMHFFKFYVSRSSATRFSRGGKKYYIYFVYKRCGQTEMSSGTVLTASIVLVEGLSTVKDWQPRSFCCSIDCYYTNDQRWQSSIGATTTDTV